jgi:hypothetical protein
MNESWHGNCSDPSGDNRCYNTGTLTCLNGNTSDTCTPNNKTTVYYDGDNDAYGYKTTTLQVCTLHPDYEFTDYDCKDNDNTTNPGASDLCDINNNVIDKDCNASNNNLDCNNFCGDLDRDGYVTDATWDSWGDETWIHQLVCSWLKDKGDCKDNDLTIYPGALELCDNKDNDCNGIIDEGCPGADKQSALAVLSSLTTSDSKSKKEIDTAIKELKDSLGNRHPEGDKNIIWIDSAHIACKHGYKVFDHEKKAVHHLSKITSTVPQVTSVINSLVSIDRMLAQTAINESAHDKYREKAIENLAKGDAATDAKHKINYYRKAWKYVNKNCEKQDKFSCIESITVTSPIGDSVSLVLDEISDKDTIFTDSEDNQVAIKTDCKKCIKVGDIIKGWTITEIEPAGILAQVCAK